MAGKGSHISQLHLPSMCPGEHGMERGSLQRVSATDSDFRTALGTLVKFLWLEPQTLRPGTPNPKSSIHSASGPHMMVVLLRGQQPGSLHRNRAGFSCWVAVKELKLSYYIGETLLFTICTHYGNLI